MFQGKRAVQLKIILMSIVLCLSVHPTIQVYKIIKLLYTEEEVAVN